MKRNNPEGRASWTERRIQPRSERRHTGRERGVSLTTAREGRALGTGNRQRRTGR